MKRLGRHARANVVAYLALFIALGGTGAYAANTIGSSDIIDESIQSVDIKNGEVKTSEYAADSVGSNAIASNAVKNSELASNVVGTGKIADGGVGSADLANDAVTSAKVAANTLTGGDIDESSLDLGGFFAAASAIGGCAADVHVPTTCGSTSLSLSRPGRVLVNASGQWLTFHLDDVAGDDADTDDPKLVRGFCRLAVDGHQIGGFQSMGEQQPAGVGASHPSTAPGTMALTGLSGVLSAGAHTVALICSEDDGDLDWSSTNLTAALVDDGAAAPGRATLAPATGGHADVPDPGKRPTSPKR